MIKNVKDGKFFRLFCFEGELCFLRFCEADSMTILKASSRSEILVRCLNFPQTKSAHKTQIYFTETFKSSFYLYISK